MMKKLAVLQRPVGRAFLWQVTAVCAAAACVLPLMSRRASAVGVPSAVIGENRRLEAHRLAARPPLSMLPGVGLESAVTATTAPAAEAAATASEGGTRESVAAPGGHAGGGAGTLQVAALQTEFERLANGFKGRVRACAGDARGVACVNGDEPSSLQSVMKLMVGVAVMDAVDRRGWRVDQEVIVRKRDLSLGVQPIAKLVTPEGFRTTIGDLVRRAIVDSDSAATDILIARLGGPRNVQAVIERHEIRGMRIDRDERHLQTESFGLTWKPGYVDSAVLSAAYKSVPAEKQEAAYRAYQKDPRDTSTAKAMVSLLQQLGDGKLLSAKSTAYLMDVMIQTVTFPDRLKAGVPAGWTLGHKTGTSSTVKGVTAATNDVGIITAPDGGRVSIAVFIGDASAPSADRAALTAKLAQAAVAHYQ